MYLVNHGLGDRLLVSNTDSHLRQLPVASEAPHTSSQSASSFYNDSSSAGRWRFATSEEERWGLRVAVSHDKVRSDGCVT